MPRQKGYGNFKTSLDNKGKPGLKTPNIDQQRQVICMALTDFQEPNWKGCNKNKDSSQGSKICQMAMTKSVTRGSFTKLFVPEWEVTHDF